MMLDKKYFFFNQNMNAFFEIAVMNILKIPPTAIFPIVTPIFDTLLFIRSN